MYIINQKEDGIYFGEILESGYYAENKSWIELQKELDKNDNL